MAGIIISTCLTTWGWIATAASARGVTTISLPVPSSEQALSAAQRYCPEGRPGSTQQLIELQEKLQRYFRAELVDWGDTVLDVSCATPFLARVWSIVRAIPRGQVRTYRWVAQQVGSPQGARAIGQAMANNPFPIVVPCHRVVGHDGRLTGFGGGLEMKERLLRMEGAWPWAPRLLDE